ncbi:cleavage stimulating factor 64 [Selaginella moellendorffii]|uniref:cleavage stimulating factor 64 n=1 Tax=Selaginella moellendorffii TaxID=88036 RepID=UPI000D1CAE47|nr:cleavage stimulating factor 64 [Selaginella moellendorffii]|eukprot:XP_002972911.2 cleavage stimulating factor 64 [Selaginella moellendorffii]
MGSSQHRCVFVGNIPYDATEEQLIQICEEVGPVVSFRLVTDRETGKPKGYGFCEFRDEETALSARRNLSGYDLNGRQLRVDFAENEKGSGGGGGGGGGGGDRNRDQGRGGSANNPGDAIGFSAAAAAAGVMAGALGSQIPLMATQGGQNGGNLPGNDALTSHLATMSKQQLYETMVQLKQLIQHDQQQARQLLITHPSLTKALFQAQIMLGMVRLPQSRQPPLPPASAPPSTFIPPAYSQQPGGIPQQPPLPQQPRPPPMPPIAPAQSMNFQGPPFGHQPQFSMGMPFQSQGQPPLPLQPPPQHSFQHPSMNIGMGSAQGRGPGMNFQQPPFGMEGGPVYGQMQMQGPPQPLPLEVEQQHLLQQVMNLTPEQINSLPPDQRQQVVQLQQVIQLQQSMR